MAIASEGFLDELVNAEVAIGAREFGERMLLGDEEGVGEVVAVIDEAAASGALDELEIWFGKVGGGGGFGLEVAVTDPAA